MRPGDFIINVPAGETQQAYCNIFEGRMIPPLDVRLRPSEADIQYGIAIKPELIEDKVLAAKLPVGRQGWTHVNSKMQPIIALKRDGKLLDIASSQSFLDLKFHDLGWIGLTPDGLVGHLQKRLLVRPYEITSRLDSSRHKRLALIGVEMRCEHVEEELKRLRADWKSQYRDSDIG